jgi:hypothetical protein
MKNSMKRIGKALGVGLVSALSFLPIKADAWQDQISVRSCAPNTNVYGDVTMGHLTNAVDGYDGFPKDIPWSALVPPTSRHGQKIVTSVDGYKLRADSRSSNSTKPFESSLTAVTYDNFNFVGDSQLWIKSNTNNTYKGFDPQRHYVGEYVVSNIFRTSGQTFRKKRNLRDFILLPNTLYLWQGPTDLNVPASQTNSQGQVDFGEFNLSCDWNQLVSSSTGDFGSNTWEGAQIVNYDGNATVTLNANTNIGGFIDKIVITRTDNLGNRVITTNTAFSQDVVTTTAPFYNIKGSNAIHAIYGRKQFPVTVSTSGDGSGSSSFTNASVFYNDSTNLVFNAATGSQLEAIVLNGVTNTSMAGTNTYNVNFANVTNSQNVVGIFDLKKYLLSASVSGNGEASPSNLLVPYGSNAEIDVVADPDFKIGEVRKNGSLVSEASGLDSYSVPFTNVTNDQVVNATIVGKTTSGGVPHAWLSGYGFTNKTDSIETVDSDGDGMDIISEFISDTNPTNSASFFGIKNLKIDNGKVHLDLSETSTNRKYSVLGRENLSEGDWLPMTNNITGSNGTTRVDLDLNPNGPSYFYRGNVGLN